MFSYAASVLILVVESSNGAPSGWSAIHSSDAITSLGLAIASVLLVFAGLILTFPAGSGSSGDSQGEERREARRRSLRLFIPTLASMLIASLLFALIGGESQPTRASVMAIPAGGLLGISVLGAFALIGWALKAYVDEHEHVVPGAYQAGMVIWLIVGTMTWLTISNADHWLPGDYLGFDLPWPGSLLIGVSIALAVLRYAQKNAASDQSDRSLRVEIASRACNKALLTLFALYVIAFQRPVSAWEHGSKIWPLLISCITFGAVMRVGYLLVGAFPAAESAELPFRKLLTWTRRNRSIRRI